MTGRAKYGSTSPAEQTGADVVRLGPPPERQQGQRQLTGGQGGVRSVQPEALQVGEPALGELDRLGGAPGEHVGLDEVVPRRADALGVVALDGEVERLVQAADAVVVAPRWPSSEPSTCRA